MKSEDIIKKITAIVRDIVDPNLAEMTSETQSQDVDGWDSISHVMIIGEIEKEFKFQFDLKDLYRIVSVGDIVQLIQSKATI